MGLIVSSRLRVYVFVLTCLTGEVDNGDLGSCVVDTTKQEQEQEEESKQGKNWNKETNN